MSPAYVSRFAALLCGVQWLMPVLAADPTPPNTAALTGDALFAKAVENLGNLRGVEIQFTQEMKTPATAGTKHELRGRYVRGENDKYFLEFTSRVADEISTQQFISDGAKLWIITQTERVGKDPKPQFGAAFINLDDFQAEYVKFEKETGREKLDQAEVDTALREVRNELGMNGITVTLSELKSKMEFARLLPIDLATTRNCQILVGEWNKETLNKLAPDKPAREGAKETIAELWKKRVGPVGTPRKALVFLEQPDFGPLRLDSVRPSRVEWLGLMRPEGPDEVLTAMNFKVGPALTEQEMQTLFTVPEARQTKAQTLQSLRIIERKRDEMLSRRPTR